MNNCELMISAIDVQDLSALIDLYEELTEKKTNIHKARSIYSRIAENESYVILGAKVNNKLVGTVMGVFCDDIVGDCQQFVVLENFIVKNEYRGKGIGRQLLHSMEDIAAKRVCSYIMLVSGNTKENAHKFYDKMGYKIDYVKGFKKRIAT